MFYVEVDIQCAAIDNHGCMMLLLCMYFLPKSDLHLQVNRDGDANANENGTSYDYEYELRVCTISTEVLLRYHTQCSA